MILRTGTGPAGFHIADIIRVGIMPVRNRDPDGAARFQVTEGIFQHRRDQLRRNMLEHMLRKQPINRRLAADEFRPGSRARCIEKTDIGTEPVRRRGRTAKHDLQRQPRGHRPSQPAFLIPVAQGTPKILEKFSTKSHDAHDLLTKLHNTAAQPIAKSGKPVIRHDIRQGRDLIG